MKKIFKKILAFEIWEVIPWLKIYGNPAPYWVLNEREIRAAAGIMLVIGMITFFAVYSTKDFSLLYPTLWVFWLQFFITVFFWTRYAPFSVLGRLLVRKQQPDYVWAVQKRFAWLLWLIMASSMVIVTLGFGITGSVPFIICGICLTFMWLESAAGICIGCKIYWFLLNKWYIAQPIHRPACPGGSCSINLQR